jgi:SAM-dependent methyltransferase
MLDRKIEYQKMSEVEAGHWWYRNLHESVYEQILAFSRDKNINILDCGCGTGGFIYYLFNKGYKNIKGFDLSQDAIDIFCKNNPELKSNVQVLDIKKSAVSFPQKSFDVIICNDVLYFLKMDEIKTVIAGFYKLLKNNGIVILNLPALNIFKGIHDKAVGINRRFKKGDIKTITLSTEFTTQYLTFRLFLLAPLVIVTRLFQRLKLYLFKDAKIESDIDLPPRLVNNLLFNICGLEKKVFKKTPFGSSLFCVLLKN